MFLKKHRAYSAYKRNIIEEPCNTAIRIGNVIGGSFIWTTKNSPPNREWFELDIKWSELINEFNLEGTVDLTTI